MKVSTRGRYSLRLLLDIAQHQHEGFVSLADIAERQGISKKYLEQLIPALNKANMLLANRGFNGGYKLNRSLDEYTVGEILRVAEKNILPVSCISEDCPEKCERYDDCLTMPVWKGLYKAVSDYLDSVTLKDIIEHRITVE